ncbi:hypothetical protein [Nocardioides rubriscoriae]|uniref:hypothetical protein n=1 Tax=Nocardioides rubriscoriae TaxID=642762 RepID=UPI0011DFF739|nr:hypothetical protein [Nocardioides rubriscoriae]
MNQSYVTLVTALLFVSALGAWSLFTVRHELSARRAVRRRTVARVGVTARPAVRRVAATSGR